MNKDRRISKSENAIENAFLELIEERGFENVHLVDVARLANVNRNTIYIRYGSKEDIIAAIISKTYDFSLTQVNFDKMMKSRPNKRDIKKLMVDILTALKNNEDIYRIVLTDKGLSGYMDHIINSIRKIIISSVPDVKRNYTIVEYIVQGVYGIIRSWIVYDIGDIDENATLIADIVFSSSRHLSFR